MAEGLDDFPSKQNQITTRNSHTFLIGSAPACYRSYPSSNPDISQKYKKYEYKMGDISKGVGKHTLARQKTHTKKTI